MNHNKPDDQQSVPYKSWFDQGVELRRKYWGNQYGATDKDKELAHEKGLPYRGRPVGLLGKRDLTQPRHWTEFEGPIQRPCIIFLGGDDTINPESANGGAKWIEQLLGIAGVPAKKRSYDIFSAVYFKPHWTALERRLFAIKHGNIGRSERLESFDGHSRHKRALSTDPDYCQDLYKKILLPLISKNDGKERLPIDQAAKSLRRINFVTHCHGTFVALEMQDLMERDLKRLKYSKQEQAFLFSQMSLVSFAASELPYGYSKMNTMHFASLSDGNFSMAQDEQLSAPGLLAHQASGQEEVPNFVVTLKGKNESLYVSKQIGKDVETSIQPDHVLGYFTGPWRKMSVTDSGRKMSWVAALMLKANLSESLQAEGKEKSAPRINGITKILTPIQYQEGSHKSDNMVNILSTRISDDDKKKLMIQALQNGEPYQHVLDSGHVVWRSVEADRKKEANHLLTLSKAERKAAATLFHVLNPSEKTAVRFNPDLLDQMNQDPTNYMNIFSKASKNIR